MIDAAGVQWVSLRLRLPEPIRSQGRLRSKNSGGGITPAAIAALIEGGLCSVNAFRRPNGPFGASQSAGNVLMRLNFHPWTVKGWAGKQKGDT